MSQKPSQTSLCHEMLNDKRIIEAKRLIQEAVESHQNKIQGIKPGDPTKKQQYHDVLDKFAQLRGGKLFFPYIGSGMGKGALVELLDGSIKYDLISGIGVHLFGHSHPELIQAAIDAALSDTIMQGHLQQNVDAIELAEILVKASKLDHCFISSSGAMANENALKIAFQKKHPASRILAFENCFMGRTNTLAQITDKPSFREGLPSTLHVDYIPFYDHRNPEESTAKAVEVLKRYLYRYPKEYAAMSFELVQGEGGFNTGTTEFFTTLMTILKEHQVAIIVDEIQTFGRTSTLFAFQHFGLDKFVDIVTIGKLSQVCATLFCNDFTPRAGLLSQTFTSSTSAIRAGTVIINNLINQNYYGKEGKVASLHLHFVDNLKAIEQRHPDLIEGPYGIGAMIAFTPYKGNAKAATEYIHRLFEAGVISFIAGSNPTRVRFLLPIGAISHDDIDKVTVIIEQTLTSR